MSESLLWTLIIVGVLIIAVLLIYIKTQYGKLKELKNEHAKLQAQAEKKQETLKLDAAESLRVIATVMLDDQVELSEGCIRIKVLLDNLDPSLHEDSQFKIFAHMADQLAHMPTHEARKKVEKKIIEKLDQQRFKLEAQHREEIREASKRLLKWLERPLKAVE